jgi:glycosyltransferase involved in cell wall biosynthesis
MGRRLKIVWVAGAGAHQWAFLPPLMLRERGHQVILACIDGSPSKAKAQEVGLPVKTVNLPKKLQDIPAIVRGIGELYSLFRAEHPDVVHYYIIPVSFWARIAAWLAGVPVRVYKPPSLWDLDIRAYRWIEYTTAWMDSAIVASSKPLEAFYRRSPLTRHKAVLSYYGFPLQPFDPRTDGSIVRQELGLGSDDLVVGMVAYLVPPIQRFNRRLGIKGHEILLEAARTVVAQDKRVRFLIVGDEPPRPDRGMYMARLKQMAQELGVQDHVLFTGYRSDIPNILAAVDLVVVPSLSENVGGAVEPLLMEKPVVASNVGGLPDVVIDAETGFLVPPSDPHALAEAILKMVALTPEERRCMGQKGRVIIQDRFEIGKTVDQLESLYCTILQRDNP